MQALQKAGDRRLKATTIAAQNAEHALEGAARQEFRLRIGRRRNQRHTDDDIGLDQRYRKRT